MDGYFIGNIYAAQDEEFLILNKVTKIINCCATEAPNLFVDHGIEYLSFPWRDQMDTIILDLQDKYITKIVHFLEDSFERGESILVHSMQGICFVFIFDYKNCFYTFFLVARCCVVTIAFLIMRFGISLEDAIAFVSIFHPAMKIQPYFMKQLELFASRRGVTRNILKMNSLDEKTTLTHDQLLLRNTYWNSLPPIPSNNVTNSTKLVNNKRRVIFSQKLTSEEPSSNLPIKSILSIPLVSNTIASNSKGILKKKVSPLVNNPPSNPLLLKHTPIPIMLQKSREQVTQRIVSRPMSASIPLSSSLTSNTFVSSSNGSMSSSSRPRSAPSPMKSMTPLPSSTLTQQKVITTVEPSTNNTSIDEIKTKKKKKKKTKKVVASDPSRLMKPTQSSLMKSNDTKTRK